MQQRASRPAVSLFFAPAPPLTCSCRLCLVHTRYTLHIEPTGDYEVFFDLESKAKGKIVEDWGFPKPMIDDPADSKPSDWVRVK